MPELAKQAVLRTSLAMYALIGGITGGVFILGVSLSIVKEPTLWFYDAVIGIIFVASLTWLATTTLTLTRAFVHYRSLFYTKNVPLADIVGAKIIVGLSSFYAYQRLVITVREKTGNREIIINTGLFDGTEIKRWVGTLNARLN